jgi:hypothetical protein
MSMWEVNIKVDLNEIGCYGINWTQLILELSMFVLCMTNQVLSNRLGGRMFYLANTATIR